jgi:hypothetical protein
VAGPIERLGSNFVAAIKNLPVRFTPKRATAGEAARAQPELAQRVWLLIETALTLGFPYLPRLPVHHEMLGGGENRRKRV